MLTGKAKEDFEKWYYTNYHRSVNYGVIKEDEVYAFFNTLHKTFKNALLVDFFDTVDIYVNALRYNKTYFQPFCNHLLHEKYETRSEALKQAFTQANKIYNERNN